MTSNPTSSVRHCSIDDASLLRGIRLEALLDSPQAYGSTYEECRTWADRHWRALCREWNYYIAEDKGRVVGVASGGKNELHPGTRWLYGMYVSPASRGEGIAEQLVDVVEQWARKEGVDALYLHVSEPMLRARAFYERVGFNATGEVMTMDRDASILLHTMVKSLD
jgi:GNAT superfamily N-acetyltransferase